MRVAVYMKRGDPPRGRPGQATVVSPVQFSVNGARGSLLRFLFSLARVLSGDLRSQRPRGARDHHHWAASARRRPVSRMRSPSCPVAAAVDSSRPGADRHQQTPRGASPARGARKPCRSAAALPCAWFRLRRGKPHVRRSCQTSPRSSAGSTVCWLAAAPRPRSPTKAGLCWEMSPTPNHIMSISGHRASHRHMRQHRGWKYAQCRVLCPEQRGC